MRLLLFLILLLFSNDCFCKGPNALRSTVKAIFKIKSVRATAKEVERDALRGVEGSLGSSAALVVGAVGQTAVDGGLKIKFKAFDGEGATFISSDEASLGVGWSF